MAMLLAAPFCTAAIVPFQSTRELEERVRAGHGVSASGVGSQDREAGADCQPTIDFSVSVGPAVVTAEDLQELEEAGNDITAGGTCTRSESH